jgi:hypothetical protein
VGFARERPGQAVISLTPAEEPVGAHDCSAEAHSL